MINRKLLAWLVLILLSPSALAKNTINIELNLKRIDSRVDAGPPTQVLDYVRKFSSSYVFEQSAQQPNSLQELVVVTFDKTGEELTRSTINDNSRVKSEEFLEDGTIIGSTIYVANASFYLQAPSNTHKVAFYRPKFTNKNMTLELIDDAIIQENKQTSDGFPKDTVKTFSTRAAATTSILTASTPTFYNVETVLDNGDSKNRFDIVFLGDGYTADELDKFAQLVEEFKNFYSTASPFNTYGHLFNIHRIDVTSNESGVDNTYTDNIEKDTALDAGMGPNSNLLRFNRLKVFDLLSTHLPKESADAFVVVVNDNFGRANSAIIVRGTTDGVTNVLLHELGHTFSLGDEYAEKGRCNESGKEPVSGNITLESSKALVKWGHWLDEQTPAPTIAEDIDVMIANGVIEEAEREFAPIVFSKGDQEADPDNPSCLQSFIPALNSRMRRSRADEFGPVNEEIIVRNLLGQLPFVDQLQPVENTVDSVILMDSLSPNSLELSASTSIPASLTWALEDLSSSTAPDFSVDPATLMSNRHFELEVQAQHSTPRVIKDPDNDLTSTQRWKLYTDACSVQPENVNNLSVINIGNSNLQANWEKDKYAAYYQVELRKDGELIDQKQIIDNQILFSELEENRLYDVSVTAFNRCGQSDIATESKATTLCEDAPKGDFAPLLTRLGDTFAEISWDTVKNADSYHVSYQLTSDPSSTFSPINSITSNRATLTNLPANTSITATVKATNSCSSALVETTTFTTRTECSSAPKAPNIVVISDSGPTYFTVSWGAVTGAYEYILYHYHNGRYAGKATTTSTSHTFTGIEEEGTNVIQVVAKNSCGNSAKAFATYDNIGCSEPPPTPTGLFASNVGYSDYSLSWNDQNDAEHYQITTLVDGDFVTISPLKNTTWSAKNLEPGSTQYVNLKAKNACGLSDGAFISVTLDSQCSVPPDAPEFAEFSNVEAASYSVEWSAVSSATHYKLETANNQGFNTYEPIADTRFSITGLDPKTEQAVKIRAVNDCGESEAIIISTETRAHCSGDIPIPSALNITETGASFTTLSWPAANGVEQYQLARVNQQGYAEFITTNALNHTFEDLEVGSMQAFELRSVAECGSSENATYSGIMQLLTCEQAIDQGIDDEACVIPGGYMEVNGISSGWFGWRRYTVDIPSGMSTLDTRVFGGSGNASLYVRKGQNPSTSNYDCRSRNSGNNENCIIENPEPGTWHIGIYSGWSSVSNTNLSAEWK